MGDRVTGRARGFQPAFGSPAFSTARELATVQVPVVCSYGARSPTSMVRLARSLAAAIPTARTQRIEGAGHAAPFDATTNFVQLIADTITSWEGRSVS